MKLNKWLSMLMVSCSLLISFTACDDDDNDSQELSLGAPVLTEIAAPTIPVIINRLWEVSQWRVMRRGLPVCGLTDRNISEADS